VANSVCQSKAMAGLVIERGQNGSGKGIETMAVVVVDRKP